MPKGKPLTDEERKEIYEARMLGETRAEIARAYGISADSVTQIVRRYKEKENIVAHRETIVAGNKKTGRLVSLGDVRRYDGTCVVAGKAHSKSFTADSIAEATEMWRSWCDELRGSKAEAPKPTPQPTPKPVSKPAPKPAVQKPVKEEPKVNETSQKQGTSVYVIWTKGEQPRLFGAYISMEAALAEVDRLNDVASFLVSERVFDVEELALRA